MQSCPESARAGANHIDMSGHRNAVFLRIAFKSFFVTRGRYKPFGVIPRGAYFALQVKNHIVRPLGVTLPAAIQRKTLHLQIKDFFGVQTEFFG